VAKNNWKTLINLAQTNGGNKSNLKKSSFILKIVVRNLNPPKIELAQTNMK